MSLADHARDVIVLGGVGGDGEGPALAQCDRGLGGFEVAVGDGDLGTFPREQHAHGAPVADRGVGFADIHLPAADDEHAPVCHASAHAMRLGRAQGGSKA